MVRLKKTDILFIAPCIIFLLLIIVYPLVFSLRASFLSWGEVRPKALEFIWFDNYRKVLSDSDFPAVLRNSIVFVLGTVLLQLVMGIIIAMALDSPRVRIKYRNLFTVFLLMPMAISPVAAGVIWRSILNVRSGFVNVILKAVGLPTPFWFSDPKLALFSLILVDAWQWTPFAMLLVLAGLQSVPREPIEAASIDGASGFQIFWHMILPLIMPVIIIVLLIRTMEAFKLFDLIFMLTGGGPGINTYLMSFKIYKLALNHFKMGQACAFSYILNIIILMISIVYLRYYFRKIIL